MKIEILSDKNTVAHRAAELIAAAIMRNQSDKSNQPYPDFRIALAGGSTPRLLYQLLSRPPWKTSIPWNHVRWFLGDERFVPPDHPDSNYRMIRENLFAPAGVPETKQFPMRTELPTPQATAEDYAEILHDQLSHASAGSENDPPLFDLALLGMGDDGHTASLFPHTSALDEQVNPAVANYVEKLKSWRITLTPPVLLSAAQKTILVTGEEKATALAEVLQGNLDIKRYPAQMLRDADGQSNNTTWLIDKAAAKLLK